MLKETKKQHTRIRHLLQSYALARPSVRLSLRTLSSKARKKGDGDDWIYACKTGLYDNTVKDAAIQVIGRECTSQCIWKTVHLGGYEAQALLPKADADFKKVMGYGQFLSVDTRPVRANGETTKAIVMIFKEKIREDYRVEEVRDPFLSLNIKCPRGSFDSSIEPSKNDVAFENPTVVIQLARRLFSDSYPASAHMTLTTKNLSEDEKSIQPCGSMLPQYKFGDKPCDAAKTSIRRSPEQKDCDNGILTPNKSDLNPWVLAKLHSGLGKRKNRADNFTPPAECKQVGEAADGDIGRISGSDMEYHTFLPSPLSSSPLNYQAKSRRQFESHKFKSPVNSSPITSTSWRRSIPRSGIRSKISLQRSTVNKNNNLPSFEKRLRHSTFSCSDLPKPSISKPFVSPFSSCGFINTPSRKRHGPQIRNIDNNNYKLLQASIPSACSPAGEPSEPLNTDRRNHTKDSPSQCESQLDWLKVSMPPLTKSINDGNVQDTLSEEKNYSLEAFSSIRTSASAIQRSLSVFGDIIFDDPATTGSSLLGSRASSPSWNALTRGDIQMYAKTLTGLLSGRDITVQTDRLTQSIEDVVYCD